MTDIKFKTKKNKFRSSIKEHPTEKCPTCNQPLRCFLDVKYCRKCEGPEIARQIELEKTEDLKKLKLDRSKMLLQTLKKKSGISKKFYKKTFKNFITEIPVKIYTKKDIKLLKDVYNQCFEYAKNFKSHNIKNHCIFISGYNDEKNKELGIGSGKTHIISAIGNYLLDRYYRVYYVKEPDLIDKLLRTFKESNQDIGSLLDLITNVDFFILDDLGKSGRTEWEINQIYKLISRLDEREINYAVTSELSLDELYKKYGEWISRIEEHCKTGGFIMNMKLPNYRKLNLQYEDKEDYTDLNDVYNDDVPF